MSSSEYVLIFVSIVLGLGLADVLVSVHRLLRARERVRWDWAAPACALIAVMLLLMIWWSLFPKNTTLPTTIGEFLPLFVALVLVFLLASSALPDEVPAEGLDLKAYYQRNGAYFWSLMTADLAWTLGMEVGPKLLAGGDPLGLVADRLADFVILLLFASLIFIRRRWWNAIVILAAMAGPIHWLSRSIG